MMSSYETIPQSITNSVEVQRSNSDVLPFCPRGLRQIMLNIVIDKTVSLHRCQFEPRMKESVAPASRCTRLSRHKFLLSTLASSNEARGRCQKYCHLVIGRYRSRFLSSRKVMSTIVVSIIVNIIFNWLMVRLDWLRDAGVVSSGTLHDELFLSSLLSTGSLHQRSHRW